eukprot:scaffold213118_cov18-Prasinocladus_malaysianus.AAC.1
MKRALESDDDEGPSPSVPDPGTYDGEPPDEEQAEEEVGGAPSLRQAAGPPCMALRDFRALFRCSCVGLKSREL